MKINMRIGILAALAALAAGGCVKPRITDTERSAMEQNLIAQAVERGIDNMSFSAFAGRSAVVDYSRLSPQTEKDYICGVLETHLAASGVRVVEKADEAQLKLRVYCGVLATDNTECNVGTPSLPIPVPYTDLSFAIPEMSIFKRVSRSASCRITVAVYDIASGDLLCAYRGVSSRTFFNRWVVLMFIPFSTRDVELADFGSSTLDFAN